MSNHKTVAILHHPGDLSARSGMYPLAEALQAEPVFYRATWWLLQQKSFVIGSRARAWGQKHFGSEWNALMPYWDEWKLSRGISRETTVVHFLWAEFAAPRFPAWFKYRDRIMVGTYHASASRLPVLLKHNRTMHHFDGITLMSEKQKPFFFERGVSNAKIRTILHGVDSRWFCPSPEKASRAPDGPLKGFLIGITERDHEFLAKLMRVLPPGVLDLSVCTCKDHQVHYRDSPNTTILPRISDAELLESYRNADLLMMPVMDCTANNSILESMACGTPVMTNRTGGISEYVPNDCNIIMPGKNVDDWVDTLKDLHANRNRLSAMRPKVRIWAESLDWHVVAGRYHAFYEELRSL